MSKISFVAVCCLLVVSACSTPYGKNGLAGGYTDVRLAENRHIVTFQGNGHTSQSEVEIMCLRRAAELTLMGGFDYFVVEDGLTDKSVAYHTKPGTINTTGTVNAYGSSTSAGNAYGQGYYNNGYSQTRVSSSSTGTWNATATGRATTTYTPPQTFAINRFHSRITVAMYHGKPRSTQANQVDARLFLESLGVAPPPKIESSPKRDRD